MNLKKLIPLAASIAVLGACTTVRDGPQTSAGPVTVKIVGLNDFHGNLEPLSRPSTVIGEDGIEHEVRAGGAAHLATAVAQHRKGAASSAGSRH